MPDEQRRPRPGRTYAVGSPAPDRPPTPNPIFGRNKALDAAVNAVAKDHGRIERFNDNPVRPADFDSQHGQRIAADHLLELKVNSRARRAVSRLTQICAHAGASLVLVVAFSISGLTLGLTVWLMKRLFADELGERLPIILFSSITSAVLFGGGAAYVAYRFTTKHK